MNKAGLVTGIAVWIVAGAVGCKPKAGGPGGPGGAPVPNVVIASAVHEEISEKLALVGTVLANEMVEIRPETDGMVAEIIFNEGQPVKKGDLLVRLDEREAQAAMAEAEANFKLTQSTFERSKQLFNDKLISQQEFDQAAANYQSSQASVEVLRQQLRQMRVYAPFEGIVGARQISPGQVVTRNTPLTVLVDLDPVKVELNVPERYIGQLAEKQEVQLTAAAFGNRKFSAQVYFVSPAIDPGTRTALVRAYSANPKHELKPGMFVSAELTISTRDKSVVIPETGLAQVQDQNNAVVFTLSPENTVVPKRVKLGIRLPGKVEILQGLELGERVIIEGTQKVVPGGKVNVAKT